MSQGMPHPHHFQRYRPVGKVANLFKGVVVMLQKFERPTAHCQTSTQTRMGTCEQDELMFLFGLYVAAEPCDFRKRLMNKVRDAVNINYLDTQI
jgi:hypothetical protein